MSQVRRYQNGDKVVTECIFCAGQFEEPQKLNDWIHCDGENGGCGNKYRITIAPTAIKGEE